MRWTMLDKNNVKWEPCCRGRNCCPKVCFDGDDVLIKDDDDNIVRVTVDQLIDIVQYIHENRYTN